MDIDTLLVDLTNLTESEVKELARGLYKELYLDSETRTHDGEGVKFWDDRFEHAFYNASQWKTYSSEKDVLDKRRIARIRWIGEFIAGRVPNTECWLIPTSAKTSKRLYLSFPKGYVVWLVSRTEGGWRFSSAHLAEGHQIRGYVRVKGAKRIWKYGEKKIAPI